MKLKTITTPETYQKHTNKRINIRSKLKNILDSSISIAEWHPSNLNSKIMSSIRTKRSNMNLMTNNS